MRRSNTVSSVVRLAPKIFLVDEFADFDVREELERQLEERLTTADLDARPALSSFAPSADDDQLSLIHHQGEIIRLVAPAGSGKTQTIINRVLHTVKNGRKPERILCLTFDNSATRALKEKVAEQLASLNDPRDDFQITTLNAFGYRLLREYFPSEFKPVIETNRIWRLIKEVKEGLASTPQGRLRHDALPSTLKNRFYSEFIGFLKNSLLDPRNISPQAFADFIITEKTAEVFFQPDTTNDQKKMVIQAILWMHKTYETYLQRENRIDFDDQKLRPLCSLDLYPSILSVVQRRFDEVLVDEFQDINRLDFALIKQIAGKCRLIVTGDDDQAIYGFRGCSPSYIIDLAKHLQQKIHSIELRRNYRCPRNVVEHSTRLIRHNTWRLEKSPIAARPDDASIKIVESTTATAEGKMISTAIERIKRRTTGLRHADFGVLYRTNAQSLPIQLQFILNNIPYNVREQDNILHNEELEKLLGVLRVKLATQSSAPVSPRDGVLTVKAYFQWFDDRLSARIEDCFSRQSGFFETIRSDSFLRALPKARDSRFADVMLDVVAAPSLFKTLDILAKTFKGLRGMIGTLEDAVDGGVPLGEVYELAASFRGRVDSFVETIDGALRQARGAHAGNERDGVALATYFKAKGLQWHTVILTSCNQGLIPHKRAPIEDERKLFYVALTRASSNLIVSYLRTSCKIKVAPSCFLREAGLHE
jgi:DNA helicase II / ATP-dependent DNA helicase PcrA